MNKKNKPSMLRSLGTALAVALGIIAFAYGVQVTDVNFETTRSEDRLTQLKRVIRALVKPDIIEYDLVETNIEIPFYMPCQAGQDISAPLFDTSQPYLEASAYCASPGEIVIIEGHNFPPGTEGPLDFATSSGIKKPLGNFIADSAGYFRVEVELPVRQPVAEAQHIRATVRVRVSGPKITPTARVTWDKIIETVFMALLATAIGTVMAIPVSFLAARNLMVENRSPLSSVSFSLIGWPVGIYLGLLVAGNTRSLLAPLFENSLVSLALLIIGVAAIFLILRWMVTPGETKTNDFGSGLIRILALVLVAVITVGVLIALEKLSRSFGLAIIEPLGVFGFLGNFLYQIGEASTLIIPAFTALAAGAVVGSTLGKIGQTISDKSPEPIVKIVNLITSSLAVATLFSLVGAGINWLYQIDNLTKTLYWPAGIGAGVGLILALLVHPKQSLPTGMTIYFIIRTILNGTRSVEALVMAIVFVIWVGIGPFAGSLALALHTVAALAKLYSEQVESILPGPLEAIQATGANRLQTIVYAVVPQIVSPYISFTMYRWDINVRMSTIIGFVGGGGIGFLLQQNINLLAYRAASVQMLAIAVVVALMDYVSSAVREKMV
jgi:phosphonate ABC transporter permease subunit PhnE